MVGKCLLNARYFFCYGYGAFKVGIVLIVHLLLPPPVRVLASESISSSLTMGSVPLIVERVCLPGS